MIRKLIAEPILIKQFLVLSFLLVVGADALTQPDWNVNPGAYTNNMTITGAINLNHEESRDANDIVAAFIDGECRGVAHTVLQGSVDRYSV